MNKIFLWIKACRSPFFTGTLVPVLLGSAAGYSQTGIFHADRFIMTLFGALLFHAGANLANDYFDYKAGMDGLGTPKTPYSGGSRFIQKGILAPKTVLLACVMSYSLGSAIGLYLNFILPGNVILYLGLAGFFLGFFYSAGPFKMGYRRLGEFTVFVAFGPLLVIGSYYTQAQLIDLESVMISVPAGVLMSLVLIINEFPDREQDMAAGRKNFLIIFGKKGTVLIYKVIVIFLYVFTFLMIALNIYPVYCWAVFLTLPAVFKIFVEINENFDKIYKLLPVNAMTIALHSAYGLLITAAFIFEGLVK
jgi:1,4-dihydroxy-2-naphthoate octaprenyltransferase